MLVAWVRANEKDRYWNWPLFNGCNSISYHTFAKHLVGRVYGIKHSHSIGGFIQRYFLERGFGYVIIPNPFVIHNHI